jgi:tetratricopeptide (TPR) repeat protein
MQANMDAAQQDVYEMQKLFGSEEANIYQAVLLYRTGQPLPALKLLGESIRSTSYQDAASQIWIGFHLGEASRVANQPDKALTLWRRLLQAYPQSHLLRLSLADLLNQKKKYKEAKAVATLNSSTINSNLTDALLMQALIASRGLNTNDEVLLASQMAARLQTQSLRQESLIERPRLIFQIAYGNNLASGLALSIENWKIQKEPTDAVLFLQAALALNQAKSAEPVLRWAASTKYTDPQLSLLIDAVLKHPSWSGRS